MVRDALGGSRPFDAARHDAFQQMVEAFGDPENLAIKRRVAAAIAAGEPPSDMAWDRRGRAGIRIALRQLKAAGHAPPILTGWLASFDHSGPEAGEDDAALHHEG
jgi:hypothetical protein